MQYLRILPGRLISLAYLCLFIVLPLTLGCGSDNNSGQSGVAAIKSIALSKGALSPAFSPSVKNYTVDLAGTDTPGVSLAVTLENTAAKLTINGNERSSGQSVPVALVDGPNTIKIGTESENGKNTDAVTITINKPALNTRVWVLDGLGGVHAEGATLTLKDADDGLLEDNISIPPEKNGSMILALDTTKKYNIYAKGTNTAQASFINFDPSRENALTLYCLPKWSPEYAAEAPMIIDVSFGGGEYDPYDPSFDPNVITWKTLAPGANTITDARENLYWTKITAVSKNPITSVVGPPIPILVTVDEIASASLLDSLLDSFLLEHAAPHTLNGQLYWRTTFLTTLGYYWNQNITDNHWLNIVVYDMANNRTEQRVFVTLTDYGPDVSGDADISTMSPVLTTAQAQTYGISANIPIINPVDIPAINPVDSFGGYCYAVLDFNMVGAGVRGYEVWRSTDNALFEKVGNKYWYYGELTIYSRPSHIDITPDLTENTAYYYKVRFFNGNPANGGYSQFSNTLSVKPLPVFTTRLTEPAHGSVSRKLWPAFRFKSTNPALFDSQLSDRMVFTLYLKDINANYPIFNIQFQIDFTRLDEEGNPRVYFRDYANNVSSPWAWAEAAYYSEEYGRNLPFVRLEDDGAVAIETDNEGFEYAARISSGADPSSNAWYMLPGASYEWSIFGVMGGIINQPGFGSNPINAAYFYKSWPVPPGAPSDAQNNAFSFGSILDYGLGAPNGFFTLTIAPDAR
ncbi:MAG: cadherin-like beta sandwich domain-containing protein [Holophagales bacterium]|nr:cadherin-like beta sandwich domain-containing protein [Holophagales bacterium]